MQNSSFINITKTEAKMFGTSQKLAKINQLSVTISGSAINHITEFKYLSVISDKHLSWDKHIKAIVSKAGRRVDMLGRVRRYITSHRANAIYLSMIRLILEIWCLGLGVLRGSKQRNYTSSAGTRRENGNKGI